ncbi:MAG: bifunctional phosphoribosylaminoimidazolecarboxamide formyltransferase/IMP cyclohydrolase [Firmicutes bacterium]|nr:bifunctional phosphoribosylaminoimidazolecarboxamide formyltransferase/IMP cyclohydrolase [Bacillota bacterium]
MKKYALLSVSNKTGIVEFASELVKLGYSILSTGGTAKTLIENKISCQEVSDLTGFPECLDGRVKTLHPKIHGGILALRDNPSHMEQIRNLGIDIIDIVAVNLYPFRQTILKEDCSFDLAVENIDIGGPSMIRAAAKNYGGVAVLVEHSDYDGVIAEIKSKGEVSLKTKKELMAKAFRHTANYDSLIANYLATATYEVFPSDLSIPFSLVTELRYGENPHQKAAFYQDLIPRKNSLSTALQLNGKELSYNNIGDAAAALELLNEFNECACVAVKHASPCGVTMGKNSLEAYISVYNADPVSIFGGIVVFNREVCEKTASKLNEIFLEIVIAPSYNKVALEILKQKPNLRVLLIKGLENQVEFSKVLEKKYVYGGLLVQEKDASLYNENELKFVTEVKPTKEQLEQLKFAYKVVKHTKSNAIVVAREGSAIGIAGGQTNRIWACKQALERADDRANGAVLASDAFFPFNDCVEVAVQAGIKAIIQPGGSIKDQDSIDLCNKHAIAMVLCGERHFKH